MSLYLDDAATGLPKPPEVVEAVRRALAEVGASPGRGAYRLAREATAVVEGARRHLARLLGVSRAKDVIFTRGATESLNTVLKGWLRPGDRCVISGLEHNAVVRPLARLAACAGVTVDVAPCSARGELDMRALARLLSPPPRLVAMVHAGNVNGALLPAPEIARLCNERGVPFLLDAAQTAGAVPVDFAGWGLGMLACSGHKGLLGPPGVGVLVIREDLDVLPLTEGGTGSRSEEDTQPAFRPDRYECGTPNLPGIAGVGAGAAWVLARGVSAIGARKTELAAHLEDGLSGLPGVRVLRPAIRGTSAVAFTVSEVNPQEIAALLDAGFDIAVRAGLHCAPLAHKTLGTFPEGAVRVSPGHGTSPEDIEAFLSALRAILPHR